ncbi:cdc42 homolog [Boleophthalmus pectinirostris]|uniref:cdc42 homolog n=1 Tax=Boleophthalmus pectinirostris TaxID=150288 RepID=UPI00242B11E1|nr:cdc42 homolog [Boleophthalmus pectinirostris]
MWPQDMDKNKPRCVSEPVFGPDFDAGSMSSRLLRAREFSVNAIRRRSGSAAERKVSCVLVGDGAVGKTSLVVSYTTNGYPTEYVPTAFDNFTVMVVVDGKPVRLQLCDTAGQKWGLMDGAINDELERLRPLCYQNADVFLLCYSVVRPCSFQNLTQRWLPEIRLHCPDSPLVLVGTQVDLREDVQVLIQLAQNQQRPVGCEEGRRLALEIGAVGFCECSALTQKDLKDTFDTAILASLQEGAICGGEGEEERRRGDTLKLTLRKKTPEKMKRLSETWWKKINCLMGEHSCELI